MMFLFSGYKDCGHANLCHQEPYPKAVLVLSLIRKNRMEDGLYMDLFWYVPGILPSVENPMRMGAGTSIMIRRQHPSSMFPHDLPLAISSPKTSASKRFFPLLGFITVKRVYLVNTSIHCFLVHNSGSNLRTLKVEFVCDD